MPRPVFTISVVLLLQTAFAQQTPNELMSTATELGLIQEPGRVNLFYSPTAKAKGQRYRDSLLQVTSFYAQRTNVHEPCTVVVLTKEQWKAMGAMAPWPMPHILMAPSSRVTLSGVGNIIYLPASLKAPAGRDEVDFVEAISFHEAGHLFAGNGGMFAGVNWIDEWIANVFATAYLREIGRSNPTLVDDPIPRYTSLSDLNYLYGDVGLTNYGWFQGQLMRLAAKYLEGKSAEAAFANLRRVLRTNGKPVENPALAEGGQNNEASFRVMEAIWPGFKSQAGPFVQPSTLPKLKRDQCHEQTSQPAGRNPKPQLIIENRGAEQIAGKFPGNTERAIPPGTWIRYQLAPGEQARVGDYCFTMATEHSLAILE